MNDVAKKAMIVAFIATTRARSLSLADLLFGAYRRDVLALLLLRPEQSLHVREIARLTTRPANTLYRELATLADAGLLLRREQGNQVHYRANTGNPIFGELQSILKKTSGIADVLRYALEPLSDCIHLAFVYGSIAKGEEGPRSDVDVVIVGDLTFEQALNALAPAEEVFRREVSPRVYGTAEFREKVRRRDAFVSRIISGPKIMLIGDVDELGKPGRNRKAKAA